MQFIYVKKRGGGEKPNVHWHTLQFIRAEMGIKTK